MFRRLVNLIKSWFGAGLDTLENPDLLLTQAQDEMRAVHAKNRERAVQAITQKNNLQQMVNEQQKLVDNLQAKAEMALKRGDRDLALNLLKEKQSYEQSLALTRTNLEQAIETAEQVKIAIKREEERIRQKTAEALALKAQWKNSQIQIAMSKALDQMQEFNNMESTFGRAQEKIKQASSEMQARNELGKTSVQARLQALETTETDVAAENELAQLESKLGLGAQTTVSRPTTTVADNSVESELARLEAKISGSGS